MTALVEMVYAGRVQAFLQVGVGYWAVDTGLLVSGLTVYSVALLGR